VAVDPGFPPGPAGSCLDFDTLDVPADRFLTAGRAWRAYRSGELDAGRCGLPGRRDNGAGWIASQIVRDLAALNKVELLAWDSWGLGRTAFDALAAEDLTLLDRVAHVTTDAGNVSLPNVRTLYGTDSRLTVPHRIHTLDHSVDGDPIDATFASDDVAGLVQRSIPLLVS
jgi:hypothetical protein